MKLFSVKSIAAISALVAVTIWSVSSSDNRAEARMPSCKGMDEKISVGTSVASANLMPNILGREGSIRNDARDLLGKAVETARQSTPPPCPSCTTKFVPEVELNSVPNKVNSDSAEAGECEAQIARTRQSPYKVNDLRFKSLDEMYEWIKDFSQGGGTHGAKLYEACSGGCSPRYRFNIVPESGQYVLDATATCGYPRDRDDNKYKLTAAYSWTCAE